MELKDKDGALIVPTIKSKEELLKEVARRIPGLVGRHQRLAAMEAQRAEMARRAAAASAAAPKPAPKPAGKGGGRKGKGR